MTYFLRQQDQEVAGKSADETDLPANHRVDFFGVEGIGTSVVYVVDRSGSMYGQRFERAMAELVRSIDTLSAEQQFFVYLFNDRTLPLLDLDPADGLILATAENKSAARDWIWKQRPDSTTDPGRALELALAMHPEIVFLLTDGEFDDPTKVRQRIRFSNRSRTAIHTIAFENEEGSRTLEAIARENQGKFEFVP